MTDLKTLPQATYPFSNLTFPRKGFENNTFFGFREKPLTVEKYMGQPGYSFKGDLIYDFVNNHGYNKTARIIVQDFLPYFLSPVLNKIKVFVNNKLMTAETLDFDIERQKDGAFLIIRFYFFLPPNSKIKLIVPLDKLMRNFEDYPHDPNRGHDLPATPVFYQFFDHTKSRNIEVKRSTEPVEMISSDNIVFKIPEPDFSMPFNNITLCFVFLGYFFLTVFKLSVKKESSHWIFNKEETIKQKIIKFIKGVFGRGDKIKVE